MKKVKKFLLGNIKTVVAFAIGVIISGTSVYAATILFASNQVSYNNANSGATSTNVQDALDELYTKANTWINPTTFGISMNTSKTILATNGGIIIRRNGQTHLIRNNNWSVEKDHIRQIFSELGPYNSSTKLGYLVDRSEVRCIASDFSCIVFESGYVYCRDNSDNSNCSVNSDGSVNCN